MDQHRIGGTAKFRAAAFWGGIGVLIIILLGSVGCSRTPSEYGQFPPNAEGIYLTGLRAPAGDSARLLRNAHYLKLMGRPEMAMRELEAAYQQDPNNIKVLNTLALACDEMGDFKRAQKLYQEALALDVSNQALNNNLCFSYYLAGQYDQAEGCFRQALTRNSKNIMARNNLGLLLCRRGRTEEALRLWQDAEGRVAAQKKMRQVMMALGISEPSHYAQLPPPAPEATPAKAALPSTPASQPQVPAPPPARAKEPVKVAANPAPAAVTPELKPAAPVIAAKPAPPQPEKVAAAVPTQTPRASLQPLAYSAPAPMQKKPAPLVLAAAPPKAQTPPAPPKQTADTVKQPAPAAAPPASKPEKIKLSAATPPKHSAPEKQAQSGIEVANASGARNLARQTRTRLKKEGFKVVSIGNYRPANLENTIIYYRPEAEKVARALNAKFFPQSYLKIGKKFARNADIKVVLGKDLVEPPTQADKSVVAAPKVAAKSHKTQPPPAAAPAASTPVAAKAPQAAPAPAVAAAPPAQVKARESSPKPYLTAAELENAAIEIRNGSGTKNLAHKARSMLAEEGFNVTCIGNHIDFGAEHTTIFYRPGAERIARNLKAKFFSNSTMEKSTKLHNDVAVKVLLGKDLLQRTDVMAKLDD